MKVKSAAGIVCYVKSVPKTVNFYKTLGFTFRKNETRHATGYINWFWIDFREAEAGDKSVRGKAKTRNGGGGQLLCLSVDDIDAAYKSLIAKGLRPSSEPHETSRGNHEFIIRDPDGYALTIFERA